MKNYQLFLLLLSSSIFLGLQSPTATRQKPKTILVAVAHPDDETGFSPVLARFAREGYKVQLVVATDGRFATRGEIRNPDSAARSNREQVVCSCEKLGIEPPIFYNEISLDRKFGERDGVRASAETGARVRNQLKALIDSLQPHRILTYGPDGEYGHPEHIIMGSLVTELLLRERWAGKYPLYYFGWPASMEKGNDGWIRYADDTYFNMVVTYTDADEEKAFASLNCYERMSKKERAEIIEHERKRNNLLYFREFVTAKGKKRDF